MPYNRENKLASFCFTNAALLGLALAGAGLVGAADAGTTTAGGVIHTASVVRADARTGRLVRKMVVQPVAPAAGAEPVVVESDQALRALVDREVESAAGKYGVDPQLVHAVIRVESNYNPVAVSPKGAQGLMQLIPSTARRMGVDNSFSVRDNIEGGVRYLRYLLDRFGDHRLALAAYNAGEGAVQRYGNVPPYMETQDYVRRAARLYSQATRGNAPAPGAAASRPDDAAHSDAPPPTRPIEIYRDSEGRICIRTR